MPLDLLLWIASGLSGLLGEVVRSIPVIACHGSKGSNYPVFS
jgi:hypothetical protein